MDKEKEQYMDWDTPDEPMDFFDEEDVESREEDFGWKEDPDEEDAFDEEDDLEVEEASDEDDLSDEDAFDEEDEPEEEEDSDDPDDEDAWDEADEDETDPVDQDDFEEDAFDEEDDLDDEDLPGEEKELSDEDDDLDELDDSGEDDFFDHLEEDEGSEETPKEKPAKKKSKKKKKKKKKAKGRKEVKKRSGGILHIDFKNRRKLHFGRGLKHLLIALLVVAAIGGIAKLYMEFYVSRSYSVESTTAKEDVGTTNYVIFADRLLKYSSDGVSMLSGDGTALWNTTYDISNPTLDISKESMIVYGKKGNNIYVFNESGRTGSITTELPILKAKVSADGNVAAILEDGETTWIFYYSATGETIAKAKTRIDSPGYPVDIDVSNNSELLMISYIYVDGTVPTSYVTFYNFGAAGQNQMDNLVSGYTYPDLMVPQVSFLNDSKAVAVSENGLILYSGAAIPAESLSAREETDIVSSFVSDSGIGLIVKNDQEKGKPYILKLYGLNGKLKTTKEFDAEYTNMVVSDGQLLLYNDKQLTIFTMNGHLKYSGTIKEGSIQDVCRTGYNKYLIVLDNSVETIKVSWY